MQKILRILMLLLIAGVIFMFSSQTYEEQTLIPLLKETLQDQPFEQTLSRIYIPYFGSTISVESKGYYYFIEFIIRKFAHLFLFGSLAVALFLVFMALTSRKAFLSVLLAFVGTGMYAVMDELHQMRTGGRSPLMEDVLLDLIGAGIALIIFTPVYFIRKRYGK